jgi:hypothetical protein
VTRPRLSRSLHTDPLPVRAARRMARPHEPAGPPQGRIPDGAAGRYSSEPRGAHDPARRRRTGLQCKRLGLAGAQAASSSPAPLPRWPRLRACLPQPQWHHPAGPGAILKLLERLPVAAAYGLASIELRPAPAHLPPSDQPFGRYVAPGRIVLYAQPRPPWHFAGGLGATQARAFTRCGARITRHPGSLATTVHWPGGSLQRFMLMEVLLHELGHHRLQRHHGKRRERIARTRDHEAFAHRWARRHRARVLDTEVAA